MCVYSAVTLYSLTVIHRVSKKLCKSTKINLCDNVRWSHFPPHLIYVNLWLCHLCQKFLKLVEIWQSSDRNNFAQFFWQTVHWGFSFFYHDTLWARSSCSRVHASAVGLENALHASSFLMSSFSQPVWSEILLNNSCSLLTTTRCTRSFHSVGTEEDITDSSTVLQSAKEWYVLIFMQLLQWVKKIAPGFFSDIFPKRLGIFSPNFTRLLHVPIYARL